MVVRLGWGCVPVRRFLGIVGSRSGSFLAALATVVVALIGLEFVGRSVLNVEAGDHEPFALLAHERDDHGRVLDAVVNLPSDDRGELFIVGGSTVREGFLPDAVVQDELDRVLGDDAPRLTTLYSFDQTIPETARIVGNLPLEEGDTVVIGINPRRLGFGPESWLTEFDASRFSLLDVAPLERLSEDLPDISQQLFGEDVSAPSNASSLFTPWTQLTVFEKRLFARNWLEGRLSTQTTSSWGALTAGDFGEVEWGALADLDLRTLRQPIRYGFGSNPLTDAEKAEIAIAVADERVPAFVEHHRFDASLLAALAQEIEAAGADVVLLQLPRAPQSTDAYGPVWDTHDRVVADIAALAGGDVIDVRELQFGDDDFFDLEHLLAAGRPELTEEFLHALFDDEFSLS